MTMKKETPKVSKNVTINDLAIMVAKGFDSVHKEIKSQIGLVREDMKSEIGSVREDMKSEFSSVREDMKSEIGSVREDMKSEIGSVREDMKSEFSSVREDMLNMEDRLTVRINGLEKIITDRVLNKEPKNSEIYSLGLRVTKIEKTIGIK